MPDEPKPISMTRKAPAPPATSKPVKPFNQDAPEHVEPKLRVVKKTVKQVVKDEALEARVAALENQKIVKPEPTPARPRITRVAVEYDNFGAPKALVPTYE